MVGSIFPVPLNYTNWRMMKIDANLMYLVWEMDTILFYPNLDAFLIGYGHNQLARASIRSTGGGIDHFQAG